MKLKVNDQIPDAKIFNLVNGEPKEQNIAEVLGSNASNKQIIEEKIHDLNLKLKKPEFQNDQTFKNEIDFFNFVLEKSN